MATPHIESKLEDIAEVVLMPGDPLRAKYIAENFLEDAKLVNTVRNMFGYTGYYKGKRVTVFASGMGVPSIGIYSYELFKFYDVKKIIRIGTSGSFHKDIKILDVVLSTGAYCKSYFDQLLDNRDINYIEASHILNQKIKKVADGKHIPLKIGKTITSDVFDLYADNEEVFKANFPGNDYLAVEMEAFGLFYVAHKLGREASCLMTVVDSFYDKRSLSSEEREKSLNQMIELALDSAVF
ncbi:MAG TPA: purine-nucleoside phosphorylase [Candidatus Faecimonas gallistercoris]|nr:purine-nucleoside phosphorylase [Candidatus Faecimonas gallistercoris]